MTRKPSEPEVGEVVAASGASRASEMAKPNIAVKEDAAEL